MRVRPRICLRNRAEGKGEDLRWPISKPFEVDEVQKRGKAKRGESTATERMGNNEEETFRGLEKTIVLPILLKSVAGPKSRRTKIRTI